MMRILMAPVDRIGEGGVSHPQQDVAPATGGKRSKRGAPGTTADHAYGVQPELHALIPAPGASAA